MFVVTFHKQRNKYTLISPIKDIELRSNLKPVNKFFRHRFYWLLSVYSDMILIINKIKRCVESLFPRNKDFGTQCKCMKKWTVIFFLIELRTKSLYLI